MIPVKNVLAWYTRLLAWGGGALWLTVVAGDRGWLDHPWIVLILVLAVVGLRAGQIPLSKYSYLTQIGVPVLAGAVTAGPTLVVLTLGVGVFAADGVILKKPTWVALINSGREVLAFVAAFGAYAFVLQLTGSSGVSIEYLPAAMALAGMYFFAARSLFYFTLLIRGKLEHDERLMLLRYEILAYLLTIIAVVIAVGAVMTLAPAGWAAVLMVLAVLGLLTKRILEEAIAAEELNKIHLRERVITSNVTLADTFRQMEELAHRVLDWSDFRVYRVRGELFEPIYRGTHGRVGRGQPPADGPALRLQAVRERRPVVVEDARRDRRILAPDEHALSMMYVPLRFGDETVGVLELDHHKNREYGPKEMAAASTFASQLATAMHIADLRAPLVETVERIGIQVRALAETTERLRSAASAAAAAAQNIRTGAGEQERFVAGGQEASAALASAAAGVATDGADVARVAHEAGEVAASNRDVIRDAISRLVELKRFVADSSDQVSGAEPDLGAPGRLHRYHPGDRRSHQPDLAQRRNRGGPGRPAGQGLRRGGRRGPAAGDPERPGLARSLDAGRHHPGPGGGHRLPHEPGTGRGERGREPERRRRTRPRRHRALGPRGHRPGPPHRGRGPGPGAGGGPADRSDGQHRRRQLAGARRIERDGGARRRGRGRPRRARACDDRAAGRGRPAAGNRPALRFRRPVSLLERVYVAARQQPGRPGGLPRAGPRRDRQDTPHDPARRLVGRGDRARRRAAPARLSQPDRRGRDRARPHRFLKALQKIEDAEGRVRVERWGPRTLDLDIVRFGTRRLRDPDLVIPHPELPRREFWQREIAEVEARLAEQAR